MRKTTISREASLSTKSRVAALSTRGGITPVRRYSAGCSRSCTCRRQQVCRGGIRGRACRGHQNSTRRRKQASHYRNLGLQPFLLPNKRSSPFLVRRRKEPRMLRYRVESADSSSLNVYGRYFNPGTRRRSAIGRPGVRGTSGQCNQDKNKQQSLGTIWIHGSFPRCSSLDWGFVSLALSKRSALAAGAGGIGLRSGWRGLTGQRSEPGQANCLLRGFRRYRSTAIRFLGVTK